MPNLMPLPALQRLQYTPPDLRDVPFVERVLDDPLPWSIALAVVAIAAVWGFNRAGKLKLGLLGAAGALLAAGGLLLADLLRSSPREAVMDTSARPVDAVVAGDAADAGRLLDDTLTISAGRLPIPGNREVLLGAIESFPGLAGVRKHRVNEVRASLTGPNTARSQVLVAIDGDVPRISWWQLDWALRSGEWRLTRLEPLWILGYEDF